MNITLSLRNGWLMLGGVGLPFAVHGVLLFMYRSKFSIVNYTTNPASFTSAFNTVSTVSTVTLAIGFLLASVGFKASVQSIAPIRFRIALWAGWLLLLGVQLFAFLLWHAVIYTVIKGVY
jgi:hypothetical protein